MNELVKNILSDLRVEVLDEFNRNFTRKAFFDQPWPARKMDTGRGTLLVVSGAMRRSLRCTAARGSLYFSSELPYFSIHNRGGKVPVTPAMRRYFWAMYYRNVPPEGATGKRADRKSRTAAGAASASAVFLFFLGHRLFIFTLLYYKYILSDNRNRRIAAVTVNHQS